MVFGVVDGVVLVVCEVVFGFEVVCETVVGVVVGFGAVVFEEVVAPHKAWQAVEVNLVLKLKVERPLFLAATSHNHLFF